MKIVSRRRFLGSAAAVPLALHSRLSGLATSSLEANTKPAAVATAGPSCLLIDAEEHCVLRESLAGFERGLSVASIPYIRAVASKLEPARTIVLPGAVMPSDEFAATLSRFCRQGGTLIHESGAAYATEDMFATEQRLLRAYFGLVLQTPIDVWDNTQHKFQGVPGPPPYIHYHWPSRTIVRDFSRALPVYSDVRLDPSKPMSDQSMAFIRGIPVCRWSRLGHGEALFLGSPLGPHLRSGDREAQALLQNLLLATEAT